jgi:methylmalonyl-CoA epimerase
VPSPGDRIRTVDHVGIAVPDIAAAAPLYVDALGAQFLGGGQNPVNGLRVVHLKLPGLKLELLAPTREDSIISPALAERGPGLHHITFLVDDLPSTIDAWAEHGLRTVGDDLSSPNWQEAFLRPQDTFGALLQFVATARDWNTPTSEYTLADVLAGRVEFRDYVPCLRS